MLLQSELKAIADHLLHTKPAALHALLSRKDTIFSKISGSWSRTRDRDVPSIMQRLVRAQIAVDVPNDDLLLTFVITTLLFLSRIGRLSEWCVGRRRNLDVAQRVDT